MADRELTEAERVALLNKVTWALSNACDLADFKVTLALWTRYDAEHAALREVARAAEAEQDAETADEVIAATSRMLAALAALEAAHPGVLEER